MAEPQSVWTRLCFQVLVCNGKWWGKVIAPPPGTLDSDALAEVGPYNLPEDALRALVAWLAMVADSDDKIVLAHREGGKQGYIMTSRLTSLPEEGS